jgi:hypothetical protein
MDLLARPVGEITFEDVVEFCGEQAPESTVLDYKQQMPRDLAKHIAAMSNRYGGLIIVGIEEDPEKGTPQRYDGIENKGKLVERANQFATNVRPFPTCTVRTTNEVNGKVFLLLRIAEGGAPPYTTTSDPTVYLRTGNVSIPLRQADADVVDRLYAKRRGAETVRWQHEQRAETRLEAVVTRLSMREDQSDAPTPSPLLTQTLAMEKSHLLIAHLQPFYPYEELAKPWDLQSKLDELRMRDGSSRFFPERQLQPIADGLLWAQGGSPYRLFGCHQVYADGLVYAAESTVMPSTQPNNVLHLDQIARLLYLTLRFGARLYASLDYTGLVRGGVRLTNAQGRPVEKIRMPTRGIFFPSDPPLAIDNEYSWQLEADTHQLNTDDWLLTYFKERMHRIHWDLGVHDIKDEALDFVITSLGVQ